MRQELVDDLFSGDCALPPYSGILATPLHSYNVKKRMPGETEATRLEVEELTEWSLDGHGFVQLDIVAQPNRVLSSHTEEIVAALPQLRNDCPGGFRCGVQDSYPVIARGISFLDYIRRNGTATVIQRLVPR